MPPSSEGDAYLLLERLRWGGAPPTCPQCRATGHCYYLRPAGGVSRPTRTGAPTERRVWKCGSCRRQFSVLTGTVFEGTRISLRVWVGVIDEWARAPVSPTAGEVAGRYGISGDSARQVVRRVGAALEEVRAPSLRAVLQLPPERAAAVRTRTPPRPRPRRQAGPTADYGADGD